MATGNKDLFGNEVLTPSEVRKRNLDKKTERIKQRFKQLHVVPIKEGGQRLRYDDVLEILADEFCLSTITIERKLKA